MRWFVELGWADEIYWLLRYISLFRSLCDRVVYSAYYIVASLCRGLVTAELVSLGGRIGTYTAGRAGCRRVKRTISCGENTQQFLLWVRIGFIRAKRVSNCYMQEKKN